MLIGKNDERIRLIKIKVNDILKKEVLMGRIIAYDIGNKRIGVALSDPFNQMALPQETYFRKNLLSDVEFLARLAVEKEATVIVCGLPLNFDGSKSEQTLICEGFVEELKKHTDLPVVYEDERFTTKEARRVLIDGSVSRKDRKNVIDSIAASYILDGYMRKIKNK